MNHIRSRTGIPINPIFQTGSQETKMPMTLAQECGLIEAVSSGQYKFSDTPEPVEKEFNALINVKDAVNRSSYFFKFAIRHGYVWAPFSDDSTLVEVSMTDQRGKTRLGVPVWPRRAYGLYACSKGFEAEIRPIDLVSWIDFYLAVKIKKESNCVGHFWVPGLKTLCSSARNAALDLTGLWGWNFRKQYFIPEKLVKASLKRYYST